MGKFKKQPTKTTAAVKKSPKFSKPVDLKPKGIHRLAKTQSQVHSAAAKPVDKDEPTEVTLQRPFPEQRVKKPGKAKLGKVKRLTKKERQNIKKEQFLKQIQATQTAFVEDKARVKREKTDIIRDVKPLLDALPSLDSVFQFKNDKMKTGVLAYDKPKKKTQVKQERREQRTKEFQDKFAKHKSLVQAGAAMTSEQRRAAIREATRKRQQQNEDVDEKME